MAANGRGQCHMCDPRAASLAGVLKLDFGAFYRGMRPGAHRAVEAGVAQGSQPAVEHRAGFSRRSQKA